MIEIEKKSLISEAQYKIIVDKISGKSNKKTTQINYYYDTENYILFNKNETLRIRQINDCLELQFKHEKKRFNEIRISKEFSKEVNCLPRVILINGLEIIFVGTLITERIRVIFDKFTLFLDKNFYMGKVDYEIEIEAENINGMPKELLGIEFINNCCGKYTRFICELLKQKDYYEISK